MEKHLAKWSYWLGVGCAVFAFVLRGLNLVGVFAVDYLPLAAPGYMSFYKAAFLFLVISIATATSLSSGKQSG